MKEYLKWVTVMIQQAQENPKKARKTRANWVNLILDGIKSYRKDRSSPDAKYLTEMLDSDTWELIGFAVNLQYVRADHPNDDMLKYIFVHPYGTPPLIYKHKKLPIIITVGPGLRWNESILRELDDNRYNDDVEGVTG